MTLYVPLSNWMKFAIPSASQTDPAIVRVPVPTFSGANLFFLHDGDGSVYFKFGGINDDMLFDDPVTLGPSDANPINSAEFNGIPYGCTHVIFGRAQSADGYFRIRFVTTIGDR